MQSTFLSNPRTVASVDRDFVEWHRGISGYGFWAIVIRDADWLKLWNRAHEHVRRFIHPGYLRAPHVTIAACGLMHNDYFSDEQLRRQSTTLEETGIAPFHLSIGPSLDSFTTAPVLMIGDESGAIGQIRKRLRSVAADNDGAPEYQPHVTLGLYRDAFDTREVLECLADFRSPPARPVRITELSFCVYETKHIQGRFEVVKRIQLDENCL